MPKADRVYFTRFDPRSTDPTRLVDRDDTREEMTQRLERFITQPRAGSAGMVMSVVGDKGVGKSILTYAVLRELQERHSSALITVAVDCRNHRSWRDVLAGLAEGLRDELLSLTAAHLTVPEYAIPAANLLRDYAMRDAVTLTSLHTLTTTLATTAKLSGAIKLRQAALAEVSATRTSTDTTEAKEEAKVQLDDRRLTRLLTALLADLERDARAPWRVAVFIDNLDELHYAAYLTPADRETCRQEVEGVLTLREAPIALVLNARTYFAGAFARALPRPVRVEALPSPLLVDALRQHIAEEPPATRAVFATPDAQAELQWLAALPNMTPLGFLVAAFDRAELGSLSPAERATGTVEVLRAYFGDFSEERLRRLVSCFRDRPRVSREALRAALSDDYLLDKAQRDQLLLPVDFWDPRELTLDPILLPLLALEP